MAKAIKNFFSKMSAINKISFWLCLSFALTFLVASFICPPLGKIDNSVLGAIGELFSFAVLGTVITALERGVDAKVIHGNTTLQINNPDNKNEKGDE